MPTPMTHEQISEADRRYRAGEEVWMWCLHHEQHFELLTEPLSNRILYVNTHKSADEIPVRLREIQVVKNPAALKALIPAYAAARAEAWKAYDDARAEAWKAYEAAMAEADLPILALHRSEYPDTCWNGRSIFA